MLCTTCSPHEHRFRGRITLIHSTSVLAIHLFRYASLVALALLLASVAACDPCAGVSLCSGQRSIRYQGDVTLRFLGVPAEGIQVEFVRTGGVRLDRDTIRTETDALGSFSLEAEANGAGEVIGELILYPPGNTVSGPISPLRIPMSLSTGRSASDVRYLGPLSVPHLYFGAYGELFYRGGPLYVTEGVFARDVEVEFRRTAGIRVEPDTFVVRSNGAAQFPLEPRPLEVGEVVFDLLIRPPAPYQSFAVSNVRMSARFAEPSNRVLVARAGVGPHLPYVGTLYYADTQQPAVGTEVEFRRTGGIALAQDTFRTTVNSAATFSLGPVPLEAGTVTADLVIRPPAPYRSFTIAGVSLRTTEENVQNVPAGRWEVPSN